MARERTHYSVWKFCAGGFIGGLVGGLLKVGVLPLIVLSVAGALIALVIDEVGDRSKTDFSDKLGLTLGLSTLVAIPCGFVGLLVAKLFTG